MWCGGTKCILMCSPFLSDNNIVLNCFALACLHFLTVEQERWVIESCFLSSGCSIDWEWRHASKSYVVSFVSSTSGKRTLESYATIYFHSDKEASQACISPAWRTHHAISTTRQWSHQALSQCVLPSPDCGLFKCHADKDHLQTINFSATFLNRLLRTDVNWCEFQTLHIAECTNNSRLSWTNT